MSLSWPHHIRPGFVLGVSADPEQSLQRYHNVRGLRTTRKEKVTFAYLQREGKIRFVLRCLLPMTVKNWKNSESFAPRLYYELSKSD